jgi:hypothetical protein
MVAVFDEGGSISLRDRDDDQSVRSSQGVAEITAILADTLKPGIILKHGVRTAQTLVPVSLRHRFHDFEVLAFDTVGAPNREPRHILQGVDGPPAIVFCTNIRPQSVARPTKVGSDSRQRAGDG